MRIINFGSLSIDYVCRLDQFVKPGETKHSKSYMVNSGGKGLNQSIAAARAGNEVLHAGLIGRDGGFLVEKLKMACVDVSLMTQSEEVSGHAIIQVADSGQNSILLYGGTNQMLTEGYIERTLAEFKSGELVLLQNETNLVGEIIGKAADKGLMVALNAAPYSTALNAYPLEKLSWLIVNEVEAAGIVGDEGTDGLLEKLAEAYPETGILLTLGVNGARVYQHGKHFSINSCQVEAVDTTAAGDTFTGYFLYGVLNGLSMADTLRLATTASALCVQRPGAADSIPVMAEVSQVLENEVFGQLEVKQW